MKSHCVLYGVLFLFFFQLFADFFEAIYAFGLLGTSIPIEIVCVLFVFSPLLLLFVGGGLGRALRRGSLGVLGGLMLVTRLAEPLLDTRGKMLVSGLGVSCFMLLFPLLLNEAEGDRDQQSVQLGAGLSLGVMLSILLRTLNSGSDISTYAGYQAIGWVLALVAGVLLLRWLRAPTAHVEGDKPEPPARLSRVVGLSLGLAAALVLLHFAFTSPGVIARWTGANYPLVLAIAVLAMAVFAWVWARRVSQRLTPTIWVLNLAFVLALVFTILPHQIAFPADPGAYPLVEPQSPVLAVVPLVLMLALYPVIFLDFSLLARELLALRPSLRQLGEAFGLAALFTLVMIFAQVFTTAYDYIPVIGPFFRDRFWLVFLVLGVVLVLPLLLIERGALGFRGSSLSGVYPVVISLAGVGALAGAILTSSRPVMPPSDSTRLRLLTYNVQQGYDKTGQKNFDGQIEVIRAAEPDVIGLQETDTTRIAGGNADLVRYFADRLDMYSYYGPKTVPGTFGIALLSRYPIQAPRTFYMYSLGEQTATIHTQIVVGGRTFDVFVTHLGNGGPIVQQEAVLKETAGEENVILMGDFNFRPDTEQYRLTRGQLDDAWLLRWPSGNDDLGLNPVKRIDHVFVSPGIHVADAEYILSPASDHPAEVVEIEW